MGDNAARRPLHILVIDDDQDTADTLTLLLQTAGHDADAAYDASTAVALAESNPPGLVFLDLAMPRVDGIALARQLRRLPGMEQAVLVCLTGYSAAEYEKKALEAGCDVFMLKPANPVEVERIARQVADDAAALL